LSDEINVKQHIFISKIQNKNKNWLKYEGSIAYTETPLRPLV
jgi:hypothetical protein